MPPVIEKESPAAGEDHELLVELEQRAQKFETREGLLITFGVVAVGLVIGVAVLMVALNRHSGSDRAPITTAAPAATPHPGASAVNDQAQHATALGPRPSLRGRPARTRRRSTSRRPRAAGSSSRSTTRAPIPS